MDNSITKFTKGSGKYVRYIGGQDQEAKDYMHQHGILQLVEGATYEVMNDTMGWFDGHWEPAVWLTYTSKVAFNSKMFEPA